MGKRKVKAKVKVEAKPQPMSDARLEELRSRAESWRLHYGEGEGLLAGGAECIAEIDRLRAEVAAKDAEIARLTAERDEARLLSDRAIESVRLGEPRGAKPLVTFKMANGANGTGKATL